MINRRKNPNLIYEDVCFGHALAKCEFWITKLPSVRVLVTLTR
jgi:hypothetical protein